MGYQRGKFEGKGFDESEYQRYFHKHQAEYIRRKLRCIVLYHQGKEFEQISTIVSLHHQSVRKYVNIYIEGGLEALCARVIRPQSSRLNAGQRACFKETLLSKRPAEVGLGGNIWTGNINV